jgi:hypothetical protein
MQKSEETLAMDNKIYAHLLRFSMIKQKFWIYSEKLYQLNQKYHQYSCTVEGNMAQHYLHQKNAKKALLHIQKIITHQGKCLSPEVLQFIENNAQ